tara:strand:- start:597 stop:737 length:141 start_codon:yes stop_codon:yes gene_type:complete
MKVKDITIADLELLKQNLGINKLRRRVRKLEIELQDIQETKEKLGF